MKTATAAKVAHHAQNGAAPAHYHAAIQSVLSAFPAPATPDTSAARATMFVSALSGALGYHDAALGASIFAVVQPPAAA